MATDRALPRTPAFVFVLAAALLLATAGHAPAGAQAGTPLAPATAPAGPLALDSNPPAAPLAPPSNDDFDAALSVGSFTYRVAENTTEATTQAGDPAMSCGDPDYPQQSHSVWFTYTPSATGFVTVTTYNSDYDTVLAAFTGTWGALTQVACNDDISLGTIRASSFRINLTGGITYFFEIASYGQTAAGTLVFSMRVATPPANDDFAQAVTVPAPLTYTAALDVTSATIQAEDPLQGQGAQPGDCTPAQNEISVWYKYTALNVDPVTAYTYGSGYDTVLSVHTGSWPILSQVVCNDDQNGTPQSQVTFTPTLGTTYYLDITREKNAYEPPIDWLALNMVNNAPPPNDNFNGARSVSGALYTDSVDATLATRESTDPLFPTIPNYCPDAPSQNTHTVWYRYDPTSSATLIVDTFGSSYDTLLAVWVGTSPGNLVNAGCDDDYGGVQSRLTVQTQAGMRYYIEVASKVSEPAGRLVLNAHPYSAQWQTRAPLAVARDRLAAAGNGQYLFIVGGERYTTDGPEASYVPTAYVTRYDPATNLYAEMQPMPVALQDHEAVYIGGKIYVPAGYAGSGPPFYGTHLVYDIATNAWSTAAAAPWPNGRPPAYYGLASDGQGYYVTGGYDGAYILQNVWYYHVASDSWTARAPLPTPRFGHESAFLGGYLYVVAGDNDGSLPGLFSTQRYDPATNTWIQVVSQNHDRLFAAGGVLPAPGMPGKWYITGGGFSSYGYGGPLGSTEVFDPVAGTWQLLDEEYDLIVPRYHLAGVAHGSQLFAIGGYVGGIPGIVDDTERLIVDVPTAVQVTVVTAAEPPSEAPALAGALCLGALLGLAVHRSRRRRAAR